MQRLATLSANVHARLLAVLVVERQLARRAGFLLHALLAGIAVAGIAMAAGGTIPVSGLVTFFLVTATFVGRTGSGKSTLASFGTRRTPRVRSSVSRWRGLWPQRQSCCSPMMSRARWNHLAG